MLDFWRECKMSTLCTASSPSLREGYNLPYTLRNRARTAAKINVQEVSHTDEFRRFLQGYLQFYAFSSRPPIRRPRADILSG